MTALNAWNGLPADVLATLAQLPNDEVFTSPTIANAMLDLLPDEVWASPTLRFLDPATKSGVFLREVSRRLMVGLAQWEPDAKKRRQHILRQMLFGAATTSLTGEVSRRTLYQSADATGSSIRDASISPLFVPMAESSGNIHFSATDHRIKGKQCTLCKAPVTLIRDKRENFAFSFIHHTYPPPELKTMKFDVILGNPPYQIGMEDGKGNRTANVTPLYNLFVEKAISMQPKYVLMITPSRWFAGGKGLSDYRDRMLSDRRIRRLVDFENGRELFPNVNVEGGISYFLWDRDYDGDCHFDQMLDGACISSSVRDLRAGQGVFVRDNFANEIVEKVSSQIGSDGTVADDFSTSDPFGQSIKTNYQGSSEEPFEGSIPLIFINKIGHISPSQLQRNHDWVAKWKVLLPKAYGNGAGLDGRAVIGEPIALAPGSACTQSYFVAGRFNTPEQAANFATYLTTKFTRFLVLQRKISQDITPSRFLFVPSVDLNRIWTDAELYEKYGLSQTEIDYIEKVVSHRDWIDSLDSPVPETHLPGGKKYKSVDEMADSDEDSDD